MLGFRSALHLTLQHINPLDPEIVSLVDAIDSVSAEDIYALVNSPSVDAALKDGYAVCADDIADAAPNNPIRLRLKGAIAAGMNGEDLLEPGSAMRVYTGAKVPRGADFVVPKEFVTDDEDCVAITRQYTVTGRNVLVSGSDIFVGEPVLCAGTQLGPCKLGLLAASGHQKITVFRKPSVAIIATGNAILAPGQSLTEGKTFASNLVTLDAWCKRLGMKTSIDIVGDDDQGIVEKLAIAVETHDAVITSGGAWTGDRGSVMRVLDRLNWNPVFHRIKMGPGKNIGFGFLQGKPVFVLPGRPHGNLIAFLEIALPGLGKLAGHKKPGLSSIFVKLSNPVRGRQMDWTQFVFGRFEEKRGKTLIKPLEMFSRLQAMANAEGIITIPEGVEQIPAGACIPVQLLS